LTRVKRYLSDGCQVTGGHLPQSQAGGVPRLLIRGSGLGRYRRYFAPLVAFCSREDAG
jgi:hypothetical protein